MKKKALEIYENFSEIKLIEQLRDNENYFNKKNQEKRE